MIGGALLALPMMAQAQSGDIANGERIFRQCSVCHDVVDPAGNRLAGRGTNAGPNLYGLLGERPASVSGYRYSPDLARAGQAGLIWDRDSLADYLLDPVGFTRELTGDPGAQSRMSYRLTSRQDAQDVVAYLDSLGN